MTAAVERLIGQLNARGLGIIRGRDEGQLLLTGPAEAKTAAVIEAVKAFKPLLLEWIDRDQPATPEPQPDCEPEPDRRNAAESCETVQCRECAATVYVWNGDRDTAFAACRASGTGNVMCPFWRRGLGPEWYPAARSREEWARQQAAAKQAEAMKPIPE